MTANRTPKPGQVYRSPEGRPMLYVRTEQRPGTPAPEHCFVETRDRVVFDRWLPGGTLPDGLELALDPEATGRADAVEAELRERTAERDALVAAMGRAVSVVPVAVANDLRRIFREHRDEQLRSAP